MDGLTILEIITTTKETDLLQVIAIAIITVMVVLYSLIVGLSLIEKGDVFTAIMIFGSVFTTIITVVLTKDAAPKKIVDLGYEKIIAYVDEQIISDAQVEEQYEIISKDREIYILRKKEPEETITSENVHGEQPHSWSVMAKHDKEDTVEYVLQCSKCNQEKIIVRQKETN